MHREHQRWYSPSLGRDMELLIFGHGGARVVVFPTSMGRFFEWEDRGMIHALGDHLENGWLQLYCVDSVDEESWYARWKHPHHRAIRHAQYDAYEISRGNSDELVYSYTPPQFIPNEHDPWRLEAMRRMDIILAIGRDDE